MKITKAELFLAFLLTLAFLISPALGLIFVAFVLSDALVLGRGKK